jgi:CRISPR system Cascade subunit CasD
MSTLLIRLVGPMQSWGTQSHFTIRDTGREPSKSGVIGLLCAALGRPRSAQVKDLADLKMGVRVDREGALKREFQIAQDILMAKGKGLKTGEISYRYYLSDAGFLVGLQGEESLLQQLQVALQNPRWMLFLGRKSFAPAAPIWLPDGLRLGQDLQSALLTYPPLLENITNPLRFVLEDLRGEQSRQDVPVSFAERKFTVRHVRTSFFEIPGNGSRLE